MALRSLVRSPRLLTDRSASGATEFALVLPIFLALTLGIMDMGRMLWTQVTIDHAAKRAARFAIVNGSDSASPASVDAIVARAGEHLSGLDPVQATVAVTWAPDNTPGSTVSVAVGYPFVFTALGFLGLEPRPLSATAILVIAN